MYQTHFVRDEFLERIESSPQSLLMLDYDGTLAPFVEHRDSAVPYRGIPELIAEIMSAQTRVVIVSGRNTIEVMELLGLNPAPEIWGAHGLERRRPDGTLTVGRVDRRSASAIKTALQWAQQNGLGAQVEEKAGGLAIHWRGLDPTTIEKIYQNAMVSLMPLTRVSRLSLMEFDGGLELRVRSCNKGHVVDELLSEMGDVPAAYLGDDRTDEDAFRSLQGRGLTVLVRKQLRPTAAELWLCPPDELISFLNDWLRASRGQG
jgi:trehalose 6-phosphate phosphatase